MISAIGIRKHGPRENFEMIGAILIVRFDIGDVLYDQN